MATPHKPIFSDPDVMRAGREEADRMAAQRRKEREEQIAEGDRKAKAYHQVLTDWQKRGHAAHEHRELAKAIMAGFGLTTRSESPTDLAKLSVARAAALLAELKPFDEPQPEPKP
jgi:hypothetical protein